MQEELQDKSKEELIERVEQLEDELNDRDGVSRRSVLAKAAGAAAAGAVGLYATIGSVAAAPSGTYPEISDDPFLKLRADRTRYIARTTEPSTPPSGTVAVYVRDGDL